MDQIGKGRLDLFDKVSSTGLLPDVDMLLTFQFIYTMESLEAYDKLWTRSKIGPRKQIGWKIAQGPTL